MSSEAYIDRLKLIFSQPRTFFENTTGEGIGPSLILFSITLFAAKMLGAVNSLFFLHISPIRLPYYNPFYYFGRGESLLVIPLTIFLTLIALGIFASLMHGFAKLFHGKAGYSESMKILLYSMVPFNIISLIHLVGWLSVFYSLTLCCFGVKEAHSISTGKAVTAVILSALLITIIPVALLAVLWFLM